MRLQQIAAETVAALDRGAYEAPGGTLVSIAQPLQDCVRQTRCYEPEALQAIHAQVLAQPAPHTRTELEVANETTLQGCARLVGTGQYRQIGALNFASAKHPGGGFLGGARAQEESLARSSGLYKSLLQCSSYYAVHKAHRTCLYSDRMIYSPGCPVFRTDDGGWLEQPYLVDFVTSPAPNAGAIRRNEPENVAHIGGVLKVRAARLLALAAQRGCDALVLGAWGCGVFRNDPELVAAIFGEYLRPQGQFWGRFVKVLFSVFDTSPAQNIFRAFASQFAA